MGGLAERPGGWDKGGLNYEGGGDVDGDVDGDGDGNGNDNGDGDGDGNGDDYGDGDGNGDVNAMSRHQKRVTYKEENTLRPGDGGSAAQLFPALAGIGNGEIKYLPSKPKKRIPPKKKKNFGRKKTGNNKNHPISQANTISALNETPLVPQRPKSDEDDPAAGFANQELTATQLLRKTGGILQIKDNHTEKISKLQYKIGQRQRDAYEKDQVSDSMIKEQI